MTDERLNFVPGGATAEIDNLDELNEAIRAITAPLPESRKLRDKVLAQVERLHEELERHRERAARNK